MKIKRYALRSDQLKLNLWDILKLLAGMQLDISGMVVGLWRWPKNWK